ncbi:MAG: NAD(P)/FAD-dependent oxidoreductase [Anaerolineae bacterium]|nr:NAD(P)/FAD-dependent oxidoreductase [Anaerolineae bacterium]MDW8099316.1 NAD(P)/FAD-dependent oxidoreductase [Anaerolineae bacterium]
MDFDVIIVGASSSGLYAAELLAKAGKRVAVFERQPEVDPARRTYITTAHLKQFIAEEDITILHRIQVMSLTSLGAIVDIPLNPPDWILDRNLLIKGLLARAKARGAEVFTCHRFLRFEETNGYTQLVFEQAKREIRATAGIVIGADGLYSQVARAAHIPHPPSVPIVQAEIELPPQWDPSVTRVWFDVHETRFFYWLIPESPERGVLGLVGEPASEPRRLLDRFLDKMGIQALRYQGARVALHHPGLRPWGRVGLVPIYLVGDAAGQVKVTTVGGTVTGIWGARAAASAIIKGTSYAQEMRSLKRELDLHWYIRWLLERLDNSGYERLIQYTTPAVRRFLSQRHRDQMMGSIWQLPFRAPRLLLLGLRLLLRAQRDRRAVPSYLPKPIGSRRTDVAQEHRPRRRA